MYSVEQPVTLIIYSISSPRSLTELLGKEYFALISSLVVAIGVGMGSPLESSL